jgi:hypothetical protein
MDATPPMITRANVPVRALAALGAVLLIVGLASLSVAIRAYDARPIALGSADANLDVIGGSNDMVEIIESGIHDPSLDDGIRDQLERNLIAQNALQGSGTNMLRLALPYAAPRFEAQTATIAAGLALIVGAIVTGAALWRDPTHEGGR